MVFVDGGRCGEVYDSNVCYSVVLCGIDVVQCGVIIFLYRALFVFSSVRQYFMDSAFWAATCDSTYSFCGTFTPRGATVKAILVHSGEDMSRYYGSSRTTEPTVSLPAPPDAYQGFGRVFLQNVLPYAGIEEVLDLFVEELLVSSLQRVSYTVTVSDTTRPLKATIAWMVSKYIEDCCDDSLGGCRVGYDMMWCRAMSCDCVVA